MPAVDAVYTRVQKAY